MKLSDWAHVAEIVSAVAIVLSLLYVAFELNQNTQAIQSNTHQSLLDSAQSLDYLLLEHPHLLSAVSRAEDERDDLTETEQRIFETYAQMTFSKWENVFINYKEGFVDLELWRAYDSSYRRLMSEKAYAQFWEGHRQLYIEAFQDYISNEVMSNVRH